MFDYFKKVAISSRADDELLYEFVLNEMESGVLAKGLWGKALADSDGEDSKAKSIYMKYRVQSIKDAFTAKEIAYKELTKPNLFNYIQDTIFPMTNDYTALVPNKAEKYKVPKEEESIYDEVAQELATNIRKEGLWLKAIQNTDGDENKALSLYIKYRSESIKSEKQEILDKQKAVEKKQIQEKKDKERRFQKIKNNYTQEQNDEINKIRDEINRLGYVVMSKLSVQKKAKSDYDIKYPDKYEIKIFEDEIQFTKEGKIKEKFQLTNKLWHNTVIEL